jgi:hypothetical protein
VSAHPLLLDFARARPRTPILGVGLLIVGIGAAVASGLEYRAAMQQQAGLELKLTSLTRRSRPDPTYLARSARLSEEATNIAYQLATPWTATLADLEAASEDTKDRVALLSIEPDPQKHLIRVNGEARDLPGALAYIERLQASRSLRYPLLENHEVVMDASEHPVRFAVTADWRELP